MSILSKLDVLGEKLLRAFHKVTTGSSDQGFDSLSQRYEYNVEKEKFIESIREWEAGPDNPFKNDPKPLPVSKDFMARIHTISQSGPS